MKIAEKSPFIPSKYYKFKFHYYKTLFREDLFGYYCRFTPERFPSPEPFSQDGLKPLS